MTTQAEMRSMRSDGFSNSQMADHVASSGGYNGVASGYSGNGTNGNSSGGINRVDPGLMAAVQAKTAADAAKDTGFLSAIRNGVDGVSNKFRSALSAPLSSFNEFANNSMPVKFLDSTLGIFGGHPGQTYWESQRPDMSDGGAARAEYEADNPRGKLDGFTYERTAAERAPGDARDAADRAKMYANGGGGEIYNGMRYSTDDNKIPDNQRRDSSGVSFDNNGNGGYTTAPLAGGGNNGFNSRVDVEEGGNQNISNYFSAMPNSMFKPVGNTGSISSPSLRGIPISYNSSANVATAGE